MEENLPDFADASQNGKMRDRHFLRMIFIIVLVLHHAEYGSTTKNTVEPTISTSASTMKEPVSLGLIGGFIAVSVVMLIGLVLSIIIFCRMKRKIKNLKATISSIHDGEVVQEFEKKTEDNLHKKKNANVNEYRDVHEKRPRKKDTNHNQPPKLPEPRNPTDVIISPNSLVESIKAEFKDIPQKYKVQEGDDNDTGNYRNNSALPEMEELKMPSNDFKGSSTKQVKFDSSVIVYNNESEEINDQKACREQETEFTEKMDQIVTVDVDLPSASELHEEHDENKLHEVERGMTKVSKENECADEEDSLYESYDYSSLEQKGTTKYTTLKNPFSSKATSIPPNDDAMIEEFVYEETKSGEIDTNNTNQRDVLSKNAKPRQYYDEAIYEEPVSSNFRNSGLPTFPVPDLPNRSMLSMTLETKSGKQFKAEGGKVHTTTEGFSNENIVKKSISENAESNQKAERSVSDITASRASPESPKAPKRKRKVAPKSSVSPSEGATKISINGDM